MTYTSPQIEKMLHRLIPMTRGLGIGVVDCGDGRLELWAPLEPNHNHQHTAFGGSLYCVAIAAAWGVLQLWFDELPARGSVLVQDGAMAYLKPVTGDFTARCELPEAPVMARLQKTLQRHRRARITVEAGVYLGATPVAEFRGRFVLLAED